MLTGHFFRRLTRRGPMPGRFAGADGQAVVQQICDHIVKQFTRICHLSVIGVPVDLKGMEDREEPAPAPAHPGCVDFAKTDYCRESWQLHLAELSQHLETHWHQCDYGRLCAIVPLVCHRKCLALFKLVCPESMPRPEFESHVELLDVLVEHAASAEAAALTRLFPPEHSDDPRGYPSPSAQRIAESHHSSPSHPQVLKALEYVEQSLSDPKLTVSHAADVLGIHPDYLAHLFRKEVGQRMSRYISARRVERAKNLLTSTPWRVERIANETGFANSKWFYHVFQSTTGLTPNAYRRQARARGGAEVRIP
jgi:AraC-like DNA-binding protein